MSVRRALAAATLSALLAAGLVPLTAGPAAAAGPISFGKFRADSFGPTKDDGSNRSLNDEYIVVKNTGSKAVKLGGYRVRDAANHTYTFPKGFTLKAKKSVTLHTGKGTNTASKLYWGQKWYVWNNTTETATLLGATGSKKLDTCKYSKNKQGYVSC